MENNTNNNSDKAKLPPINRFASHERIILPSQQPKRGLPTLERSISYTNIITNTSPSVNMFSPNPVSPLYPSALSPPLKKTKFDTSQHQHQHQQQQHQHQQQQQSQQESPSSFLNNNHANISYTRNQPLKEGTPPVENEDQKFFRLAKEALVATARGATANSNKDGLGSNTVAAGVIDSTLQDLLTRLQYASAPHGNPLAQLSNVRRNSIGLIDILDEYDNFPDFNNNIFRNGTDDASRHHPSGNEPGWNFLIGESVTYRSSNEEHNQEKEKLKKVDDELPRKKQLHVDNVDDDNDNTCDGSNGNGDGDKRSNKTPQLPNTSSSSSLGRKHSQDPTRRFPCDKCPMSFRRSSDLKRHEKQHLSIPPNICSSCGKGFARKDALKRHIGTLTCKRNADRKLYIENLSYLHDKGNGPDYDDEFGRSDDDIEEEDDEEDDNIKPEFPTYGYQKANDWKT